jgi:WD40 repeat protein
LGVITDQLAFTASREVQVGVGRVSIWDVATKRLLFEHDFPNQILTAIQLSPDASRLAVWMGSSMQAFELRGGRLLVEVPDAQRPVFSPDGRSVAVVTAGGGVKIADLDARTVRTVIAKQTGGVADMAFSRDNTRLVTVRGDGTVKLWEVTSGRQVLALRASVGPVQTRDWVVTGRNRMVVKTFAVRFADDGSAVVLTTTDGDPRGRLLRTTIWDGSPRK